MHASNICVCVGMNASMRVRHVLSHSRSRSFSLAHSRPPARPLSHARVRVPPLYIHALTHVCTGSLSKEQSFDVDQGRKDSHHVTQDANPDVAVQVRETNEEPQMQNETEPNAMLQKTNRAGGAERGGEGGSQYDTANNEMTHRLARGIEVKGRRR